MMRSLYSGVSGLKSHQTKMDVIGNNIANVNTTAYKAQSVTFSELMYQTTQSASGSNALTGLGGINARQIGLGVKAGAINTDIEGQGASQTTGFGSDIMITGSSFFVVSNGQQNFFTRDGSFYIDGAGNLAMSSTGYNVMGWGVDASGKIKPDTVSSLRIMSDANLTYPPEATTKATIAGVVDANDANINSASGKIMDLEIYDNQGYKYTVKMSVHAINGTAGEFYVKLDDILDSNGTSIGATALAAVQFNPGGTPVTVPDPANPGSTITVPNAAKLNFVNGKGTFDYVDATGKSAINLTFNQATLPNFQNVEINFGATSNYNKNKASTINAVPGDSSNDGYGSGRKIGDLLDVDIQKDGMIFLSYSNGQSRLIGQIAVAEFANPSGLAKEGDNLYSSTMNSGAFNGVGSDILTGGGYMTSGVLEMSNVDLSSEFTEMITTQRGFQANSRIITVSDTLLEELTNLKR